MRTRPKQCFDTELSGVEVRRPEALRASVSGTTIFIMPSRHQFVVREAVYKW